VVWAVVVITIVVGWSRLWLFMFRL
jgi:hypothetical protein